MRKPDHQFFSQKEKLSKLQVQKSQKKLSFSINLSEDWESNLIEFKWLHNWKAFSAIFFNVWRNIELINVTSHKNDNIEHRFYFVTFSCKIYWLLTYEKFLFFCDTWISISDRTLQKSELSISSTVSGKTNFLIEVNEKTLFSIVFSLEMNGKIIGFNWLRLKKECWVLWLLDL